MVAPAAGSASRQAPYWAEMFGRPLRKTNF